MLYKVTLYGHGFNPPQTNDEVVWFDDLFKLQRCIKSSWSAVGGAIEVGGKIRENTSQRYVGEIERISATPLNPDHF